MGVDWIAAAPAGNSVTRGQSPIWRHMFQQASQGQQNEPHDASIAGCAERPFSGQGWRES